MVLKFSHGHGDGKGRYGTVYRVPPSELAGAERTSLVRRKSGQRTNGPRCAVSWTGRAERCQLTAQRGRLAPRGGAINGTS